MHATFRLPPEANYFFPSSMHSYIYDTQQLEKVFGGPLPDDDSELPYEIRQNEYLKAYFSLMISDINRRKVEARTKKPKVSTTPTLEVVSVPPTQVQQHTKVKKKKRTIREHNAPRGVEYEPSKGEYTSQLTHSGEVLQIPSSTDPDVVLKRRKLVEEYIAQHSNSDTDTATFVSQIQDLLHAITTAQLHPPVNEPPEGRVLSTPMKPVSASNTNPSTPMTVPHKVLGQTDMDVLRFRDKYYCRFAAFTDYISTPMRRTRQEAMNDMTQVRSKMGAFEAMMKNPLTSSSITAMDKIVAELKAFASSLDGAPSIRGSPDGPTREPQTEVKPRSSSALPDGVFRLREMFYTTVNMYGKTISTPCRSSLGEVYDDRDFLLSEAAKRPAATSEDESFRAIDEIRKALLAHEEIRTPRKSL